jgi:hypothetical protein
MAEQEDRKLGDFVTINRFAMMFMVSTKTARRWVDRFEVFLGKTIRRNQTLCVESGAIEGFRAICHRDYEV